MKTVSLPFHDHDGTLTPALVPYLEDKRATADRDPNDADKIVVTFEKAKDAIEFLKALDREEPTEVEADPVDDAGDVHVE